MHEYIYLQEIANKICLTALDVGARRGVSEDLISIAPGVDYFGIEPDPDECDKLNQNNSTPWKTLTFIPTALGEREGSFNLHLYRQRGCSSKLIANRELGDKFSRGDYYIHEGDINVPCKRLDYLVKEVPIKNPAFLKIDVQGMEIEVFKGSQTILNESLVAVRTEVNFLQLYSELPLFSEIDLVLRPYGFIPMCFLELHEWRRSTRKKLPQLESSPFPYSKGQMIHGDILYLLSPEFFSVSNDERQIKREIRLGLISICYDQIDHAAAIFKKPYIREFCKEICAEDPLLIIQSISQKKAKKYKGLNMILRRLCNKLI